MTLQTYLVNCGNNVERVTISSKFAGELYSGDYWNVPRNFLNKEVIARGAYPSEIRGMKDVFAVITAQSRGM